MVKKRTFILLLLLVLVSLIASCTRTNKDTSEVEWRTGTKGIEFNFAKGSPPQIIYDGDRIDFIVEAWNRGVSPATGDIYITGFDQNIFLNLDRRDDFSFGPDETKTKYNEEGVYKIIYEDKGIETILPQGSDVHKTIFKAIACYDYITEASESVCVDPQPNRFERDDSCIVTDKTISGGQGAPVAITVIKEEAMTNRVRFQLTIKNVGLGDVIRKAQRSHCLDDSFSFSDYDVINVDSVYLGSNPLICEPSAYIKLSNNVGYLYCTGDLNTNLVNAYTTTLYAKLTYGYKESKQTTVELRSQ